MFFSACVVDFELTCSVGKEAWTAFLQKQLTRYVHYFAKCTENTGVGVSF